MRSSLLLLLCAAAAIAPPLVLAWALPTIPDLSGRALAVLLYGVVLAALAYHAGRARAWRDARPLIPGSGRH